MQKVHFNYISKAAFTQTKEWKAKAPVELAEKVLRAGVDKNPRQSRCGPKRETLRGFLFTLAFDPSLTNDILYGKSNN